MSSWYKRSHDGSTFYTLSQQWRDSYILAKDTTAETIKSTIEDLIEKGTVDADDNINPYSSSIPNLLKITAKYQENKVDIPAGQYIYSYGNHSLPDRLTVHNFRKDRYLDVFNKTDEIIKQVNNFLKSEAVYKSIDENMIYKFGVLLYGPPGEGKTSLIRHLVNTNESFKDAIVITINGDFPTISFLQTLSDTTKDRLKIFIFEEMTNFTISAGDIERVLTFLDGEASVNRSISFATTNYPELLPQNLVSRPSRFDKLYKMPPPNDEERGKLLTYFWGKESTQEQIEMTSGYSSAFIKEICINARRNSISLEESLKQVKDTFDIVKRDFKTSKLGI